MNEIAGSVTVLRESGKENQLPRWHSGKDSSCSAGDVSSIPGLGRSPGEGNGNTLQYSCLENPVDKEAWWATVHEVTKKSGPTEHSWACRCH